MENGARRQDGRHPWPPATSPLAAARLAYHGIDRIKPEPRSCLPPERLQSDPAAGIMP
jgi:hypothetical protein